MCSLVASSRYRFLDSLSFMLQFFFFSSRRRHTRFKCDWSSDVCSSDTSRIMYYGLSFGGIYGTMLMGTDSLFHQGLLNVPGGPIVDIARLSSFRGDLATTLSHGKPNLLNGGPGLQRLTACAPLRNAP